MCPHRTSLQAAIRSYLNRWPEFVPDVKIADWLHRIKGVGQSIHAYGTDLFLSCHGRIVRRHAGALREALGRVREASLDERFSKVG
jgi:hypothetical protein